MSPITALFSIYPDIVTHAELCKMLHIGKNTAYELLRSGELPHIKMGSKYLIPKVNIIEYISRNLH